MKFILSIMLAWLSVSMAAAKTPGEVNVGETLRETTMQGLTGDSRKLSDFRGKPLIITVWASWCGPCRKEMGSLERLNRRFGSGKRFTVIGISTDDYPDRAKEFLAQAKTSFNHFIDKDLVLENMLGANHIPLTLLIDDKGRVLGKVYGAKEWDSADSVEMIEKAFHIRM